MIKSIFLVHCIFNSFLRVSSMQDWFLPNQQHLFTSQDYLNTNSNKNYPYYYWSSEESQFNLNDERSKKKNFPTYLSALKYSFNRPLRYLEPPAINAASTYENFQTRVKSFNNFKSEFNNFPSNHRPDFTVNHKKNPKNNQDQRFKYIRDHAPKQQKEEIESTLESKVKVKKRPKNKDPLDDLKLSENGDRIEFQISGHDGPTTYVFGFDTGDGKNRQFRLEEKLKNGTVKGHYGYYDARGKLRTIKYLAGPVEGYDEKHHESNILPAGE